MSVARRLLVALILVVAVVSGPLLADYCADRCEHAAATSAGVTAPACHHTESPGWRIGSPPAPCGHEHQATVVAAPSVGPPIRALVSLAVLPASSLVNAAASRNVAIGAPELPPERGSHAVPSPLRI